MNLEHKYTIDELIEGCRTGQRKAQELIYQLFAGKMMAVCMRYGKDRFEAEDMLQTGFIRMFDKIKDFKNEGSFEGWLRRIMVNNCIEFYRKSLRMLPVSDTEITNVTEPAYEHTHLEVKDLMQIISQLSPGYRIVFNMYAIEGYSHREIAKELGISEGTSKSQLARARNILKEYILNREGKKYEQAGR